MKKALIIIFIFTLLSSSVISSNITSSHPKYQAIADEVSEFNTSLQNTFEQEKKLKNRGFFKKIFFGGDWDTAKPLENETGKNIKILESLQKRIKNCTSCSSKNKTFLESQIKEMQKEQKRIHIFSIVQARLRGLFGWFKR